MYLVPQSFGANQSNQTPQTPLSTDILLSTSGTTSVTNAAVTFDTNGPLTAVAFSLNNGGISFTNGWWARIISYTPTGATSATLVAANTAYSITAKVRVGTGTNASSSASPSGSVTSSINGDLPDPPTSVTVNRITSTTVRLFFTRPLNVGGSPLTSTSSGANVVSAMFRAWYQTGTTVTYPPATAAAAAGLQNGTQPNATWQFTYYMDITGLTAGSAYTFYVGATNQFTTAITTGTPVGSYDPTNSAVTALVNISAATTSVTLPSASVVPNIPTALTITSFSNAYVSFSWNEPVIFGSTAVTTYTIMRGAGSATPTTFTCGAGSVITTPTTATTPFACWDLLSVFLFRVFCVVCSS